MKKYHTYIWVILILVLAAPACKQEPGPKKYYIVIERDAQELASDRYKPEIQIDSIEVENDSVAYWKGIYSFVAGLVTEKKLKGQGYQPSFKYKDFDVLDENRASILSGISPSLKEKADAFTREKLANP